VFRSEIEVQLDHWQLEIMPLGKGARLPRPSSPLARKYFCIVATLFVPYSHLKAKEEVQMSTSMYLDFQIKKVTRT